MYFPPHFGGPRFPPGVPHIASQPPSDLPPWMRSRFPGWPSNTPRFGNSQPGIGPIHRGPHGPIYFGVPPSGGFSDRTNSGYFGNPFPAPPPLAFAPHDRSRTGAFH